MNKAQIEFDVAIQKRKKVLEEHLIKPMFKLAQQCAPSWENTEKTNHILRQHMQECNANGLYCNILFATDINGKQVSFNHYLDSTNKNLTGQDLSKRPFWNASSDDFYISKVYISKYNNRSCISAVHKIKNNGELIGYVVADFKLTDLPQDSQSLEDRQMWLQLKGDPSIRSGVFAQARTVSKMDEQLDDTLNTVAELINTRGVFHCKLHFSSARVTVWLYDDPYRYRIHVLDEFLDSACLIYSNKKYPEEAIISPQEIEQILKLFKLLREADETIYLRAASLNIINGFVALNFSCDGSHYIPAKEFLSKSSGFWSEDIDN